MSYCHGSQSNFIITLLSLLSYYISCLGSVLYSLWSVIHILFLLSHVRAAFAPRLSFVCHCLIHLSQLIFIVPLFFHVSSLCYILWFVPQMLHLFSHHLEFFWQFHRAQIVIHIWHLLCYLSSLCLVMSHFHSQCLLVTCYWC